MHLGVSRWCLEMDTMCWVITIFAQQSRWSSGPVVTNSCVCTMVSGFVGRRGCGYLPALSANIEKSDRRGHGGRENVGQSGGRGEKGAVYLDRNSFNEFSYIIKSQKSILALWCFFL